MKFSISKNSFASAAKDMANVAETRSPMSIVSNVLVTAHKDTQNIDLEASNLEIYLIKSVAADVSEDGSIAVPAKQLALWLSDVSGEEATVSINSGKMQVKSGKSKSRFPVVDAGEFPKIDRVGAEYVGTFSCSVIYNGVVAGSFSLGNDALRPMTNTMKIDFTDDGIVFVGGDGQRMARSSTRANTNIASALVGKRAATALHKFLSGQTGEIDVYVTPGKKIFFDGDLFSIAAIMVEFEYFDYRQIYASRVSGNYVVVDKGAVRAALRSLSHFLEDDFAFLCFASRDGKLTIGTIDDLMKNSVGFGSSEIDIIEQKGEIDIDMNYQYVLDGVNQIDGGKVVIEVGMMGQNPNALLYDFDNKDNMEYIIAPRSR